jgi:hypothetical protein
MFPLVIESNYSGFCDRVKGALLKPSLPIDCSVSKVRVYADGIPVLVLDYIGRQELLLPNEPNIWCWEIFFDGELVFAKTFDGQVYINRIPHSWSFLC